MFYWLKRRFDILLMSGKHISNNIVTVIAMTTNSAVLTDQILAGVTEYLERFVVVGAVHDSLLFHAINIAGYIFDISDAVSDVDFQFVMKYKTFFTIHSSTLLTISCSTRNLTVATIDLCAFTDTHLLY